MSILKLVDPQSTSCSEPKFLTLHNEASFITLHNKAMAAAKQLKSNYLLMFEILMKVEAEKTYQQFEVPSLYLYCVELLELSPSVTKDFITVVRKSLELPELAMAVRSMKISIFKAKKVCSVINSKNHKEWIELAAACSARIVEKAVAKANPREAVAEMLSYASADRLELKLGVSEKWANLLATTKDRLSQKLNRAISTEEALFILMSEDHKRNDPIEKAKRALARAEAKTEEKSGRSAKTETRTKTKTKTKTKTETNWVQHSRPVSAVADDDLLKLIARRLPSKVEHLVNLRDQNQCTYIDAKGARCESKRWPHKHHIKHFAEGGLHAVDNLKTLCSAHHKNKARARSLVE